MARDLPAGEPLPRRLERHLRETGLLEPGDGVLVALSGGLDSTALLHLLRFRLPAWRLRVRAAHLDHAMRPDSPADAQWVRGLCRAWGVELVTGRVAEPPTSEHAARRLRYAFLRQHLAEGERLATGHHADDQAETVLFRMTRGTGLRGLRGIPPSRGRLVRPLLPFGRGEIEAYARAVRLGHRVDVTNRDLGFARNRLRHRVVPELERLRPGAAARIAELASQARRAERGWDWVVERLEEEAVRSHDQGAVELARDVLLSYHPEARARVLRAVLRRFGSMPGRAGTQAALEFISSSASGRETHVAGGIRLERDFDTIRVTRAAAADPEAGPDEWLTIEDPSPGAGAVRLGGRRYEVVWGRRREPAGEHAEFPREQLSFPLTFRSWRPGDRIDLEYGSKKLKKLLAERRLDRRTRRRVPVLVDAGGRVLWVVGVARAAESAASEHGFNIMVRDAGQP